MLIKTGQWEQARHEGDGDGGPESHETRLANVEQTQS